MGTTDEVEGTGGGKAVLEGADAAGGLSSLR